MENLETGYYKINGTKKVLYWDEEKWMKPMKDQQGRLESWLGKLDKQPKIKSVEKMEVKDLH